MKRAVVALLCILCLGKAVAAGSRPASTAGARSTPPSAVITFHPTADVRDRLIHLGDLATVEGKDPDLVARLEAIEVGVAPLPGRVRSISAEHARVRVRQSGVDINRLLFGGAPVVLVSRRVQVISGAAIEKAAREAIEAAQPGIVAEVTFPHADVRLPAGVVELKPQGAPSIGNSSATIPIRVLVDGRPEATLAVSLRLRRRAPALVAARDLAAGAILTNEDLRVEERPVAPGPPALTDPAQAVGQQATLPLKEGATLMASMLRPAVLFRRGARVRLVCRGRSFTATVLGEALQDGIAGQPVRVRNLTSLLEVTGRVVDAQTVEVPF